MDSSRDGIGGENSASFKIVFSSECLANRPALKSQAMYTIRIDNGFTTKLQLCGKKMSQPYLHAIGIRKTLS